MGLIKRLQRITSGRVHAFLESVDDLETVLPRLVAEMEDKIRQTANAEAKALSAVKGAQRKLDEVQGRVLRFGRGAELALKQGDERTAREALEQQLRAEKEIRSLQEMLTRAEFAHQSARETREQLCGQFEELKARAGEFASRAATAQAGRKTAGTILAESRSLLDEVARLEGGLDMAEARREIQGEMDQVSGTGLERKLKDLQQDAELEERMRKLRVSKG
jgi:phage shock protein A